MVWLYRWPILAVSLAFPSGEEKEVMISTCLPSRRGRRDGRSAPSALNNHCIAGAGLPIQMIGDVQYLLLRISRL